MLEELADFWEMEADYKCIPTNAILRNKIAVMSKGVGIQAAKKYPGLAKILGKLIQEKGNHVFHLGNGLISFPTKWHFGKDVDIDLIKQSSHELVNLLKDDPAKRILVVRPGNGSLEWLRVKPIVESILTDNKFIIVSEIKKPGHRKTDE